MIGVIHREWIESKDYILQMDIEGGEYETILATRWNFKSVQDNEYWNTWCRIMVPPYTYKLGSHSWKITC